MNLDLGTIVSFILSFHDLESYEILQSSLVDGIRNTESVDDRKFLVCDFILKQLDALMLKTWLVGACSYLCFTFGRWPICALNPGQDCSAL